MKKSYYSSPVEYQTKFQWYSKGIPEECCRDFPLEFQASLTGILATSNRNFYGMVFHCNTSGIPVESLEIPVYIPVNPAVYLNHLHVYKITLNINWSGIPVKVQ